MPPDVAKGGFRQGVRYIWRRFDTARGRFKDDSDRLATTRRRTGTGGRSHRAAASSGSLERGELARQAVPRPSFRAEARHPRLAPFALGYGRAAPSTPCSGRQALLRSVQQSLRVEGYDVREEVLRSALRCATAGRAREAWPARDAALNLWRRSTECRPGIT